MTLALDHVFVFVDGEEVAPGGRVRSLLDGRGLVPSYTRRHTGQGTENLCYCFDNAYLELLFVVDANEIAAPAIARTGLATRAGWRRTGASPFGIALRGGPLPAETWDYRFDGLPPGMTIPVAIDSDDPRVPFLFGSPGTAPPIEWTDGRAGDRQTAAGLTRITGLALDLPAGAPRPPVLDALADAGILALGETDHPGGMLTLSIARAGGGTALLSLPAFAWS
jgi:hypothetical protein